MLFGYSIDLSKVRHLPKETDWHDGFGSGCDGGLEFGRVHIEIERVDIQKDRLGTNKSDRFSGTDPRERHRDDFVAGANPPSAESDFQTVRPAGHSDGMLDAGIGSQRLLALGDLWTHYEMTVVHDAPHAGINLRLVAAVLLLQVDEVHEKAKAEMKKTES